MQNLKVDIIYHLTQSDFEMEFNLCGCCPTRLLNDKTTDQKSFVKALSRAVSRSRVIIACGPLFNENGLIKTVATAIGNGTCLCNNSAYGINQDTPIEIINGSTPLVTPDGYFGGCIIESGPQTIILLTENRGFRKTIMQNLIHPYIEEISYIPTKTINIKPNLAQEPQPIAPTFDENYITQPEVEYNNEKSIEEIAAETPADNENSIDFIMDDPSVAENDQPLDEQPATDDADIMMYTDVESPEEIKERYEHPYTASESDNMFISSVEHSQDQKPQFKSKAKAMDIAIVILVLLLLLSILALVYLIVLKPYTMGVSTGEYIKEIFGLTNSSSLI